MVPAKGSVEGIPFHQSGEESTNSAEREDPGLNGWSIETSREPGRIPDGAGSAAKWHQAGRELGATICAVASEPSPRVALSKRIGPIKEECLVVGR
jgi:hypothetical protein